MRKYTKREAKEYNKFRALFQMFVSHCIYGLYYKIMYKLEVHGRENIPKDKKYIVACNHVTAADPFLSIIALRRPVAYMAKEELFTHKNPLIRFLVISLGSFAVNRDNPEKATMKTIFDIIKHVLRNICCTMPLKG